MRAGEFLNYKRWAVCGDVLNEDKYAYRIFNELKRDGFDVIGVNPRDTTGKVLKGIKDLDENPEVIDLCINPYAGIKLVKEAAELGIDKILIQPGAESDEILEYCKENGITAIKGCALVELSKNKA